jgi:(R,R)-butanediol dehydrogenase / meso-butanediol dehydrogenase / diacetyl reductase
MLAAAYRGARTFTVEQRDPVPPSPGSVRIDVAYTGICGTDLHIFHGTMDQRVTMPAVIGHEMSGRIAAIGAGVTGWTAGDAVTVMPLHWCGECPACHDGNQHICHRLDFVGIDSPGSLQGSWTVPASLLVRLPDDLPLTHGALVEPTAVAVHDVRRGNIRPGEHVVVIGGGPVGLLIASVAAAEGADVRVIELDPVRRATAQQIGLHTIDPATAPADIQAWTDGTGADVTFEVSGSASGVTTAIEVLATRGRCVMVAIHSMPREVNLFQMFWRELTLIGARVYVRDDFLRAVDLLNTGQIPAEALISRIVPLVDVTDAFTALDGGGVMKILIDCAPGAPDA